MKKNAMNTRKVGFESLLEESDLIARVVPVAAQKGLRDVCVGLLANGRRLFLAIDSQYRPTENAHSQIIRAGCLAKVLTATLMAEAVAEAKLGWDSLIGPILAPDNEYAGTLSGVTVRQLLNHTHGLDCSAVEGVAKTGNGRLNIHELYGQLAVSRISRPGEIYSYGCAGAWLTAALLEKTYDKSYLELLGDRGLFAAQSQRGLISRDGACPATGGELALSSASWLSFLESHFHSYEILRADQIPLPGWNPTEEAACLGWKSYGQGWFGHNSNLSESSAVLRFNPKRQIAIVVSAPGQAIFFTLAAVFGDLLPEFAQLMPPRLLKPNECASLELDQYPGTYARARDAVDIVLTQERTLTFAIRREQPEPPTLPRLLRAAQHNLFIPASHDAAEFAFIQFVKGNFSKTFGYLWNGKYLWRRL